MLPVTAGGRSRGTVIQLQGDVHGALPERARATLAVPRTTARYAAAGGGSKPRAAAAPPRQRARARRLRAQEAARPAEPRRHEARLQAAQGQERPGQVSVYCLVLSVNEKVNLGQISVKVVQF